MMSSCTLGHTIKSAQDHSQISSEGDTFNIERQFASFHSELITNGLSKKLLLNYAMCIGHIVKGLIENLHMPFISMTRAGSS